MSPRLSIAVLAISLVAALSTGYLLMTNAEALMVTRPFVVAEHAIPAYTVITPEMLTEKELPATLVEEPVFVSSRELLGRVSTVDIPAGTLIYRYFAVPLERFRLSSDPTMEIISFPVDTTRAVGGQVRRGHRINLYRVKAQKMPEMSLEEALRTKGAGVQLLAAAIPVVDVRGAQGQDAVPRSTGNPGQAEERSVPVSILTVAVPPEVAQDIIRLVGEVEVGYELWITLAPVPEMPVLSEVEGSVLPVPEGEGATPAGGAGSRSASEEGPP